MSATAAKGAFPYIAHRTVAEVDADQASIHDAYRSRLDELDALSRQRALTDRESRTMERLLRRTSIACGDATVSHTPLVESGVYLVIEGAR